MVGFDKQITRLANSGVDRVFMYGRWWDLAPGIWRVEFNRARPGKSKLLRVCGPGARR